MPSERSGPQSGMSNLSYINHILPDAYADDWETDLTKTSNCRCYIHPQRVTDSDGIDELQHVQGLRDCCCEHHCRHSFLCITNSDIQHCGIFLVWTSQISWRILDFPSLQLYCIPCHAGVLPDVWIDVFQLRLCLPSRSFLYPKFVSCTSRCRVRRELTLFPSSVEYTGYILPVIKMKRWLFWIVRLLTVSLSHMY